MDLVYFTDTLYLREQQSFLANIYRVVRKERFEQTVPIGCHDAVRDDVLEEFKLCRERLVLRNGSGRRDVFGDFKLQGRFIGDRHV